MTTRRVLVTGATGFIGRAVCRHLSALGHEVHAWRRASGTPVPDDSGGVAWHTHDGTDEAAIGIVTASAPDVIVHLAAQSAGPAADGEVTRLVDGNVRFGTQVLAAARAAGCRHFVNTGTYWAHLDGDHAVSLYAALKQAFARVVQYHCDAAGLRAITLTLFDTYGPGDRRGKFLDLLIAAGRSGSPLDASDGHQRLALLHVEDVARAYGVAIDRVTRLPAGTHETFGVGAGEARSLRELAVVVGEALGHPIEVRWGVRARAPRTVDAPPVLTPLPDWSPRIALDDGVAALVGQRADD